VFTSKWACSVDHADRFHGYGVLGEAGEFVNLVYDGFPTFLRVFIAFPLLSFKEEMFHNPVDGLNPILTLKLSKPYIAFRIFRKTFIYSS